MLDFGAVALGWGTMLTQLVVLLFYGFLIYLLVSLIGFLKQKTRNDEERNRKLDELIKLLEKSSRE